MWMDFAVFQEGDELNAELCLETLLIWKLIILALSCNIPFLQNIYYYKC